MGASSKETRARYREKNRAKLLAQSSEYYKLNKDAVLSRMDKRYKTGKKFFVKKIKDRYKEHVALGLCVSCSNKSLENNVFCDMCWFKSVARNRLGKKNGKENGLLLKLILEKQNYKCPYTGLKIVPGGNASLDHIKPVSKFPELAGEISNVEWVHKKINWMKMDWDKQDFIDFCLKTAEHLKGGSGS